MRYRDASELKKSHLYQGVPLLFPEKSIRVFLALVGKEEELVLVTHGNVDLKPYPRAAAVFLAICGITCVA